MGIQGEMEEQPAGKFKFSLFNMEISKKIVAGEPKFPLFQKWPFQKTIGREGLWNMGGKFGRGSWDQKFEVQKEIS